MMTGNTTQLGIDLSNYVRDTTRDNQQKLLQSLSIVIGFIIGVFLYVYLDFLSVAFFIALALYLAYLAKNNRPNTE